ncbi:hypothetical protein BDQ12DRAFT_620803 [Crucibulum laeve]|uniref:RING-type E3 ubiquitin transferase n=1 Tax=Crucibulum laeve TaxID=68775 RepID=A0A5C3MJN6_9AGAR|nr:hypothetical protein BDQ12DRAFT_620803 [Crucibulum laeve]
MSQVVARPSTSKPRGICRYYTTQRGCFAGNQCKFLHGEPASASSSDALLLTPYDQSKRCRHYANGFCLRGDKCWFMHVLDKGKAVDRQQVEEEEDQACSICFEQPVTFGLLAGCSHIFCITCIKQWRDPNGKSGDVVDSGNTKKCPMCRTPSKFITPSSRFFKQGDAEKVKIIDAYKKSMGRVPCRYFTQSLRDDSQNPLCPFGKDCFYQHLKEDGTTFVFKDGVDVCMQQHHARRDTQNGTRFSFLPLGNNLQNLPINLIINETDLNSHHAPDGTQPSTQTRETAARRLREVSRSLHQLNNAIQEGASAESLTLAFEILRLGFQSSATEGSARQDSGRRWRRSGPIVSGRTTGQRGAESDSDDGEEDGTINEGNIMHRLELLADQMLYVLRETNSNPESRSVTPPPPLEPYNSVDTPDGAGGIDASPRRLNPNNPFILDVGGIDSEDAMPDLRSVSNSSESEMESDEDGEDSVPDEDDNGDESEEEYRNPADAPMQEFDLGFDGTERRRTGRGVEQLESAWPVIQALSNSNAQAQLLTADIIADIFHSNADDSEEDLPGLEHVDYAESEEEMEDMPALVPLDPLRSIEVPPPFVTDGRGGVVWNGAAEVVDSTDSPPPAQPNRNVEFTTDGRGRVVSVGVSNTDITNIAAEEQTDVNERPQSFLGRMFQSFF